jgi:Na+/phosphate symporter
VNISNWVGFLFIPVWTVLFFVFNILQLTDIPWVLVLAPGAFENILRAIIQLWMHKLISFFVVSRDAEGVS